MKTEHKLLTRITELTLTIKANYPELYGFLMEDPITIPSIAHPVISITVLEDYLDTLKQVLSHHTLHLKTK